MSNGDVVTIDGVTGAGAVRWNGTFAIYGVTAQALNYYMIGQPAAGYTSGDKITACKVLGYRFDELMNGILNGAAANVVFSIITSVGGTLNTVDGAIS